MLPITRVVLFKHGVAYYQRDGHATDNEIIQLSFKQEQMNDVLKSLTTLDFNGGSFGSLSYDSEEPVDKRLTEFNINIPKKGAITSLLDQLKGVKVKLKYNNQAVTGAIIGIEELPVAADNHSAPCLVIFTLAKGISHYPLSQLTEIAVEDSSVQDELNSLLDILAASLNKGQKRLSIYTMGRGERKVSITYVLAAPVWKTSYRLVLPDSSSDTNNTNDDLEQTAILQGWALIDNTTDEDWRNIKLSLVAGLPISFIHDLYTPRYRQRPEIAVEQDPVTAAPVIERGYQQMLEEPEAILDAAGGDTDFLEAAAAKPVVIGAAPAEPLSRSNAFEQSINIQTTSREVGDLFSYEITQPVDVERGRSALVPILQADMTAHKILFFNAAIRNKNPLSSFCLQNTSELTLEGGPITVYEGDSYVGEAMLDTMKAGNEQIIPYSVELGVIIKAKNSLSERHYTHATKQKQLIVRHYREEYITEYSIVSTLNKTSTLYLDHPFHYELNERPDDLIEITDNYWRFRIILPAKQETTYQVVEIKHSYDVVQIPNIVYQEIQSLNQLKLISEPIKKQLEEIAIHAEQKANLNSQQKQKNNQLKKIEKGQDRIRKNIEALGNSQEESQLRQRYVKTLTTEEDQLEVLSQEINKLEKEISNKTKEINQAIDELKFS
ncbi:hypothetical protein [Spartinivicinus ruber]|uniref:hypothetical protein n=1 Tax=Spartinivicinus ruber TaxID=2683272 RepID=UPI0013D5DB9F|nr:hypothetical protein [Spartinivicinus ruber]